MLALNAKVLRYEERSLYQFEQKPLTGPVTTHTGTTVCFFYFYVDCCKNIIIKRDCDVQAMNNKWLKFCILRSSLKVLTLNGSQDFLVSMILLKLYLFLVLQ